MTRIRMVMDSEVIGIRRLWLKEVSLAVALGKLQGIRISISS